MKKNILLIIAVLLFFSSAESEPQKIAVLHPNGGEIFTIGSPVNIKWIYQEKNDIDNKIVILLYKDGLKFRTLSPSTENTGLFIWQIPPDIPEGDRYRVRIRLAKDLTVNDFSDNDFFIKKREDR